MEEDAAPSIRFVGRAIPPDAIALVGRAEVSDITCSPRHAITRNTAQRPHATLGRAGSLDVATVLAMHCRLVKERMKRPLSSSCFQMLLCVSAQAKSETIATARSTATAAGALCKFICRIPDGT